MRVLIVTEAASAHARFLSSLRDWGHQPLFAGDSKTALEAAASARPWAVLVDVGLPGGAGYDAARLLHLSAELQPAFLIAIGAGLDGPRASAAGFHAYLPGPVSPEDLRQLLDSCERAYARTRA